MKCLKMKGSDVLLFISNLITIYSFNVLRDVSSFQSTSLVDGGFSESKFHKDCPQLLNIIRENNITDHTLDCNMLEVKTNVEFEENLLQQACFFVNNILSAMCEKKLQVTPDLFKRDKVTFVCPLNFSHLPQPNSTFINYELLKKLTNKDDCSKLCYEPGSNRIHCVVLNQLNNYFAQMTTQHVEELSTHPKPSKLTIQNNENEIVTKKQEKEQHLPKSITKGKSTQQDESKVPLEVDRPSTSPDHTKLIQNSENSSVSKKQEKKQYLPESKTKEILNKSKNETRLNKVVEMHNNVTKSMKEQKTEKITSTSNEEPIVQSETKEIENENPITGDEEFEDQNEDLPNEGVGTVDDSLPYKSPLDKISTLTPKGKEIYPAEGFFQAEDSHFFFYFIMVSSIIVVCYLAFHNKNKILAYALEGTSGRRSRRRPNRARYRKLETNLEEVISSNTANLAVSSVVY